MTKRIILMFATLGLIFNSACTSSSSSEEGASEELAADAGEATEESAASDGELSAEEGDGSLAAELSEESAEVPADQTAQSDQVAPVMPEESAQVQPIEPAQEPSKTAEVEPPKQEEKPVEIAPPPTEVAETPSETPSESFSSLDEPKPKASLKKVESVPWKSGKTLLNTVYIARPKDTWKSVSEKIYKSNKSSELKKANPWISGRQLKVGDKVYYNSPNRPTDDSKIITYYEDNNIAPSSYSAQGGDNIRTVSSTLLGFDNAWKEIWATNSVESKGVLTEGTELRYWKEDAVTSQTMATAGSAGAAVGEPPAPAPQAVMPEAPLAEPSMAPPPAPEASAQQAQAEPPPMPPTEEPMAPPPSPVEEPQAMAPTAMAPAATEDSLGGLLGGDDMMTYGILGAVAVMAIVGILIRNKRRQKDLEEGFQDTQVG